MTADKALLLRILSFLVISFTTALAGCASGPQADLLHLAKDPSFKAADLQHTKTALLPVQASTPMIEAEELATMRDQLEAQWTRDRPSFALMERAKVDRALSEHPESLTLLQRYARSLKMSDDELRSLAQITSCRFVVIVVMDEYSYSSKQTPVRVYAGTGAMFLAAVGVPVKPIATGVKENPVATLAGTMSLFNAADARPVWMGSATSRGVDGLPPPDPFSRYTPVPNPEQVRPSSATKLSSLFFQVLVDSLP